MPEKAGFRHPRDDSAAQLEKRVKKPPDRKLVIAVAVLIVAASSMLARSADHGRVDLQTIQLLGGR